MAKGRTRKTAADGMAPAKDGGDGPANEVVVSVPVHCAGCARKLRRSLLRTDGFEEVTVDCSTNTVVVTGQKALEDPMMVVGMVERKTRKKVLLLSPSSPAKLPPPPAMKSKDTKKEAAATADLKNDVAELDMNMAVVLKIERHCEACCEEMKKRILKIKGVDEAVPHMKSSQLMVKGVVEPATLVGFIHKCTGRKAAIMRAEPVDTPPAAAAAMAKPTMGNGTPQDANNVKHQEPSDNLDEKNDEGVEEGTKEEVGDEEEKNEDEKTKPEKKNKGDGEGVEEGKTQVHMPNDDAINGVIEEKNQTKGHQFRLPVQAGIVAVAPETGKMDVNSLYEYYYHPAYPYAYPHYAYQQYQYPYTAAMYRPYPHYPPQTLGDENPDACTIM
uniref:Uncharacterized protein n=1 Tax=Avena sativa TaxID=4498 RepID=A0ACD5WL15_AVESA